MKFKKSLMLLMVLPLTSCSWFKKPLVIPNVDVEHLKINLPSIPLRDKSIVRTEGDYDYIDLYELSDFHGAVYYEADHSSGSYIGLQKLASYFDSKRESNGAEPIILSSGDMFQGSADSNLTRGYMVNYSMQYMGFEAMALGNHEFDWTDEWIKKNAELKYNTRTLPFLGANIKKNGKIPSFLKESVIVQRGEYKIGVVGVIGSQLEDTIIKTSIKDYEFENYAEIVSTEAARLKAEEACNAVVLLAHEGADTIVPPANVDMVFGGHAHLDASVPGTPPVVATLNYGQSVAHATMKFDKSTHAFAEISEYGLEQMASVADSLGNNAAITKILNQYAPEINKIKEIKLGKCDDTLKTDNSLKNICTSTMFESAVDSAKNVKELKINPDKIVCAFQNNRGGIRDDIKKGEINYGNVYRSFPFDNEIVLFKAKGSELAEGLSLLKDLGCYRVFEDSSYFKAKETYYVVTTDYLALSDRIGVFKELHDKDIIRTGKILRDEIAAKIYKIDNVKNEKWEKRGDFHYQSIPMVF